MASCEGARWPSLPVFVFWATVFDLGGGGGGQKSATFGERPRAWWAVLSHQLLRVVASPQTQIKISAKSVPTCGWGWGTDRDGEEDEPVTSSQATPWLTVQTPGALPYPVLSASPEQTHCSLTPALSCSFCG